MSVRPICEMWGCNGTAEGIGDIGGDEYWLCGTHRYPVPRPIPPASTEGER